MSAKVIMAALYSASLAIALMVTFPASAQQSVMKECGERWKAAKAANQTGDQKWPQFLSKCRAELANKPAGSSTTTATPPASPTTSAAKPATTTTGKAAPAPSGNVVFPPRIDPKYVKESAGIARRKTCLDQYNANKAANGGAGNGGRKWIQKGGGYYSECNKRLSGG